jgi:DNA-3-methyladenine glycosylase II
MIYLASGTGFLPACAPFEFAHSLEFLADFGPLRDDMLVINGSLTCAYQLDQQAIVVRVEAAQFADQVGLHYTWWATEALDCHQQTILEQRLSFCLSLQDNLQPLYDLAVGDAHFLPIVQQLYGYHQVKFPSAFENAIWAVLSQRNTLPAARTMRSAIVEQYGAKLAVDGRVWRAFPEPESMAAATVGEVTAVVRHAQKGPAVAAVAAAFNQIDERWLQAIDYDQALRWLLDIYGIGPWGASFVMLRGLGRMERLVSGENKLLAAIGKQYQRSGPVSEREAITLAARYGSYQGYWAHYLRVAG